MVALGSSIGPSQLVHEICHAHQHAMRIAAGFPDSALRPPAPQFLWPATRIGDCRSKSRSCYGCQYRSTIQNAG